MNSLLVGVTLEVSEGVTVGAKGGCTVGMGKDEKTGGRFESIKFWDLILKKEVNSVKGRLRLITW